MTETTPRPAVLDDPVATELLGSRQAAQLAYTWRDGTPRVVPIWFHWDGEALYFGTPLRAPKLRAIADGTPVAVTIDDATSWPYKALIMRGVAELDRLDDVAPEYAAAATRYFGEEQGAAWVGQLRGQPMFRIKVRPTQATVLDFVTRFPSALTG